MKTKLFTKELFIETINAIKKQFELDNKNADHIQEVFKDTGCGIYDNSAIIYQLFKILDIEFENEKEFSDIEYFCYELCFGEKWKPGMITENKKDIKLQTIEDLWNYLKEERKSIDLQESCPCKYLDEPCSPDCTCKNPLSSAGCDYCCSYGSAEQRKVKAKWIANKLSKDE